ncbi:MAG: aldehyde dehydrogenase family protein, partial [Acidobacteriota bacterium]
MKLPPFKNELLVDFSNRKNAQKMRDALKSVAGQLGREYPLRIGAEKIYTEDKLKSFNPSKKNEVVGVFQKATVALALQAVEEADRAFATWSRTPAERRIQYVVKAAAGLRRRKMEFSAWMVYEVGKSWAEADADTAEAIDFAEFYAREMLRLAGRQPLVKIPRETNELKYIPLGVGIVIPPWNFPLAIMAGMTLASVVAGNTVVVKPSSDSPTIAQKFVELLEEVKLPPGVVNFVTGSGGVIGDELVAHPRTRYVAFTGSKEVGLHINELASRVVPGQIWIKRVVAEMGGKDSMLVDSDTNRDEAAAGGGASAFGYQGQKCSACSRA